MRQSGAAVGGLCFCFVVHDYKSYYKCEMSRFWYFCFKKRRPRRFKRQKRDFLRWAFKNGPDKLEIVKIGGLSWELGVAQKSVEMEHYLSGHGKSSSFCKVVELPLSHWASAKSLSFRKVVPLQLRRRASAKSSAITRLSHSAITLSCSAYAKSEMGF